MNAIQIKQGGIGLIELMIAVTISLFLMIGLGTVYYGMRQNALARSGLSQLQDQQRTAMTLISGAIQQAGFFPTPGTNFSATYFTVSPPFSAAGTPVTGAASTFSVRYATGATVPMPTCSGMSSAAHIYVDTYSISTDSTNTLNCVESVDGIAGAAQPLVSGIASMAVSFGVDVNGDGTAFQYQDGGGLTADDWLNVKSVQVTLNFVNPLFGQPGQKTPLPFTRTVVLMNTL